MKIVVDTCVLKLATFPTLHNPSALIAQLGTRRAFEWWVSPAILEEYSYVLADEPGFLAEVFGVVDQCFPLTELGIIRHEPDNRFLECALAVQADFIITVNTGRGHFDKPRFGPVQVVTPGSFINLRQVRPLLLRLAAE